MRKVVVLGAGPGSRMKARIPKVLHRVAGRPMLHWVLDSVVPLEPQRIVVIIKADAQDVAASLPEYARPVVQERQLGTAHALLTALRADPIDGENQVVVLSGDMPLITSRTLLAMSQVHRRTGAAVTCVTTEADNPVGYGRVVRDGWDRVVRIVEHKDATTKEREIKEINGGAYVFDGEFIMDALEKVSADNAQGEYYLPDVVSILGEEGHAISAYKTSAEELSGVNTQDQLARVAEITRRRINRAWMREGVWMLDPSRVYIDVGVKLASSVRLYPGVHLEGRTSVAEGAEIGPDVLLRDTAVGADARITHAVAEGAVIGPGARVGPYVSLRAGAELGEGSKAGTFVEIKQSQVGRGAKIPHLAYVGDADIGEEANVGAGTITANYDGYRKHRTTVGRGANIGSNNVLVAPVTVEDEAYTGAGSVITKDVAAGSLGIERSPQREIPGYAQRRRERNQREG